MDFLLPDVIQRLDVRAELQSQTFFQGAAVIAFTAAICQPCMMPRNAKCHQLANHISPAFNGDFGAGGGVIDGITAAVQALLKGRAVFAKVVQLAGVTGDFLRAEGGSKGGCHFTDFMRVVGEGLPVGMGLVVGGMGVVGCGHGFLRIGCGYGKPPRGAVCCCRFGDSRAFEDDRRL